MEEQAKLLDRYIKDSTANMANILEEYHELSRRMDSLEEKYMELLE